MPHSFQYFILDYNFNVIPVNSKRQWDYFIEVNYPIISDNFPFIELNNTNVYIDFFGVSYDNLFHIVLDDKFGNCLGSTKKNLYNYDITLDTFNKIINGEI